MTEAHRGIAAGFLNLIAVPETLEAAQAPACDANVDGEIDAFLREMGPLQTRLFCLVQQQILAAA